MSWNGLKWPLRGRRAFTLLELIVAMVVFVIIMSIAYRSFTGSIRAWRRGTEVLEGIKHGTYALDHLVVALNSCVFFADDRQSYGFILDKNNSTLPADSISWVTASQAFVPHDLPFQHGPKRIRVFIDRDFETGDDALFAEFSPVIAPLDEENVFEPIPVLISREVQGLEVLIYDEEEEDWVEEWEDESIVPERIQITLFVASDNDSEEPIEFQRVIKISTAKNRLKGPTSGGQVQNNNQRGGSGSGGTPNIEISPKPNRGTPR